MSESKLKLAKAPIVEAVLDIDCDMPAGFNLAAMEKPAREAFRPQYPKFRNQFLEEHHIEAKANNEPAKHTAKRSVQALQFMHDDAKQLVQLRIQGFSFNRLAPYSSLDDYFPEIRRTWDLVRSIASPIQIRVVRLRYINRILLPLIGGRVELDDYFKTSPKLPGEEKLQLAGFINQNTAVEVNTGYQVTIVLASQPVEPEHLPIIFDICVADAKTADPANWDWILDEIQSLRNLKNQLFEESLTRPCLNLFQQ
jgi:uncharacterized protein (TIGR04255 family)